MVERQMFSCVDLEVTGFDPKTEEILEVAIQNFSIEDGQIKLEKSFNSLIRPLSGVDLRIFDLTGISQVELEKSSPIDVYRENIQSLLKDRIVVGHGVQLDLAFLFENKLYAMNQPYIDTLDMAQVLLPSQHSYNLESLSHEFGRINVSAHRAMADVQATLFVLENLAKIFWGLPKRVREKFLVEGVTSKFIWPTVFSDLYSLNLEQIDRKFLEKDRKVENRPFPSISDDGQHVFAHPHVEDAVVHAQNESGEHEVYVPTQISTKSLLSIEQRLAEQPDRIVLAYLKVLVYLNSQNDLVASKPINWTVLGKDIATLFTEKTTLTENIKYLHTDYTFINRLASKNRKLVVLSPLSFLSWLESHSGESFSWGGLIRVLQTIYNPETEFGDVEFSQEVIRALSSIDVCFASIVLLLKKEALSGSASIEVGTLSVYTLNKLNQALTNLVLRLEQSSVPKIPELNAAIEQIKTFCHNADKNVVKWIDFSDIRCRFETKSINLEDDLNKLISGYRSVEYYFLEREVAGYKFLSKRLGEIDLSKNKKVSKSGFNVSLLDITANSGLGAILSEDKGQSLWVFNSKYEAKKIYNLALNIKQNKYKALVQGVHGGPHKLTMNFSWRPENSIWLSYGSLFQVSSSFLDVSTLFWFLSSKDVEDNPYISTLKKQHLGYDSSLDWEAEHEKTMILESLRVISGKANINIVVYDAKKLNLAESLCKTLVG